MIDKTLQSCDPTNDQTRVKAFRDLEDWDPPWPETVISGGVNANGYGRWVRLDNKDYILSTLVDSGTGDVDTVLYDASVPNPTPINMTADIPGQAQRRLDRLGPCGTWRRPIHARDRAVRGHQDVHRGLSAHQ